MWSGTEGISRKSIIRSFAYTIVFCTIIACFLTVLDFGEGFYYNIIISLCIGFSICSCVMTTLHFFRSTRPAFKTILVVAALTIGTTAGSILGSVVSGLNPLFFFENYRMFIQILFLGLMFGAIITYFFSSWHWIVTSEARIQEEKIKRLTSEKRVAEANLKLLQAQIEPHFLFNALSNVLSLLDSDPPRGKSMLVDFIQYLRSSLSNIREEKNTLGQEIEMIRAYLNIFKVRMGDRLHFQIDLSADIQSCPFPPMLIQPLVENAIKHGLEPKVEGGEIRIRGTDNDGLIRLEVADTGLGFNETSDSGMGLSNIRERLSSLYGKRGRLILEENSPQGLKATIEVPHGQT